MIGTGWRIDLTEADADNDSDASGESWSLVVAGDTSDRGDRGALSVADSLAERLASADVAVVNMEAPVRTDAEPSEKSGPTLESSLEVPPTLREAGFDAVTLANNHAMDYGAQGLAATLSACEDVGLDTLGADENHDLALAPLERSVGGTDLAVITVCEREFGIAGGDTPGTAWQNHPDVDDRLASAADRHEAVVVVAHGGIERVPFSPPERQARFREFIDLGADAVVGHHPHVPQGWEVYGGCPILYSLGNFAFEMSNPATQWGLLADLRFRGPTLAAVTVVPVVREGGTVSELRDEPLRRKRLSYLRRLSEITADTDRLRAHWQEVAERVFLGRLGHSLRKSTGATLLSLAGDPDRYLQKNGLWDDERRHGEMLVLLNLLRNESLNAVLRTALEVRTGETADERTPASRAETRRLLQQTMTEDLYGRPHRARVLVRALVDKLRRESRQSLRSLRRRLPIRR
jgi:poly-gamma-glutamate synthesis protein (capsule biosynthesis protein)